MRALSSAFLIFFFSLTISSCKGPKSKGKEGLKDSVTTTLQGRPIIDSEIKLEEAELKAVNFDNSNMVWIPGGSFKKVSDKSSRTQIANQVQVDGFWMDEKEVTNAQFALFVEATGYQTLAERALDPIDYPTVPLDMLVPGSFVIIPTDNDDLNNKDSGVFVAGANWRHPTGPSSTIKGKENSPVVQVSYEDAVAYARWIGKRLPTEVEWKHASKGGFLVMSELLYKCHLASNKGKGEKTSSNYIGFRCVGDELRK